MRSLVAALLAPMLVSCTGPGRQPDAPETHPYFTTAGPASTEPPPPEVKAEDCSVHVYRNRTYYGALNPTGPYVYVNGEKLAMLRVGESHCLRLPPGKHSIAIRETFMLMPAKTSGNLQVEVMQGRPIFIRYSKAIAGATIIGTNTYFKEHNELEPVTEEQWRTRE